MTTTAKQVARKAENNPVLETLARCGYAASGVVHILIGVIVLGAAFGSGGGETDQAGAFKAIAEAPLGFVLLWILAIALAALALWHALDGFLVRESDAKKTWGQRISHWGQAVIFAALAYVAISVALGARPNGDDSAENASRGILAIPGGPFLLGAIGLGIGIGGVVFAVIGIRRGFRKKLTMPSGALGKGLEVLGIVGYVAKGVALAIVGILLLVAAVTVDPSAAGGLDGAIQALLALPLGPWLAGVVGAGFIAYGVFCLFRARYAKL